ncbi:hypothetical protein AMECASPLE_028446 [Ameca splendens]|uniref:Uncharacterized protein n=1 Tax=Ameca splendens TaxID=208324 RepID=A0ABV0ZF21_9TELE
MISECNQSCGLHHTAIRAPSVHEYALVNRNLIQYMCNLFVLRKCVSQMQWHDGLLSCRSKLLMRQAVSSTLHEKWSTDIPVLKENFLFFCLTLMNDCSRLPRLE